MNQELHPEFDPSLSYDHDNWYQEPSTSLGVDATVSKEMEGNFFVRQETSEEEKWVTLKGKLVPILKLERIAREELDRCREGYEFWRVQKVSPKRDFFLQSWVKLLNKAEKRWVLTWNSKNFATAQSPPLKVKNPSIEVDDSGDSEEGNSHNFDLIIPSFFFEEEINSTEIRNSQTMGTFSTVINGFSKFMKDKTEEVIDVHPEMGLIFFSPAELIDREHFQELFNTHHQQLSIGCCPSQVAYARSLFDRGKHVVTSSNCFAKWNLRLILSRGFQSVVGLVQGVVLLIVNNAEIFYRQLFEERPERSRVSFLLVLTGMVNMGEEGTSSVDDAYESDELAIYGVHLTICVDNTRSLFDRGRCEALASIPYAKLIFRWILSLDYRVYFGKTFNRVSGGCNLNGGDAGGDFWVVHLILGATRLIGKVHASRGGNCNGGAEGVHLLRPTDVLAAVKLPNGRSVKLSKRKEVVVLMCRILRSIYARSNLLPLDVFDRGKEIAHHNCFVVAEGFYTAGKGLKIRLQAMGIYNHTCFLKLVLPLMLRIVNTGDKCCESCVPEFLWLFYKTMGMCVDRFFRSSSTSTQQVSLHLIQVYASLVSRANFMTVLSYWSYFKSSVALVVVWGRLVVITLWNHIPVMLLYVVYWRGKFQLLPTWYNRRYLLLQSRASFKGQDADNSDAKLEGLLRLVMLTRMLCDRGKGEELSEEVTRHWYKGRVVLLSGWTTATDSFAQVIGALYRNTLPMQPSQHLGKTSWGKSSQTAGFFIPTPKPPPVRLLSSVHKLLITAEDSITLSILSTTSSENSSLGLCITLRTPLMMVYTRHHDLSFRYLSYLLHHQFQSLQIPHNHPLILFTTLSPHQCLRHLCPSPLHPVGQCYYCPYSRNQEKLRVAVLVSKVTLQFIRSLTIPTEYIVPEDVKAAGFQIYVEELGSVIEGHDVKKIQVHGGAEGIANKLCTSTTTELPTDADLLDRRQGFYGINKVAENQLRSCWLLVGEALQGTTLIILVFCAIVSLMVGIATKGWPKGAHDDLGIVTNIRLVVFVTATGDYQQSIQFKDLDKEKKQSSMQVTRNRYRQKKSIYDLLPDDVVHLVVETSQGARRSKWQDTRRSKWQDSAEGFNRRGVFVRMLFDRGRLHRHHEGLLPTEKHSGWGRSYRGSVMDLSTAPTTVLYSRIILHSHPLAEVKEATTSTTSRRNYVQAEDFVEEGELNADSYNAVLEQLLALVQEGFATIPGEVYAVSFCYKGNRM